VKKTTAPVRKKAKHGQPKKTRPLNMASLTWKQQNWDEISRFSDREITFTVYVLSSNALFIGGVSSESNLLNASPRLDCWFFPAQKFVEKSDCVKLWHTKIHKRAK
jgi:hypothetical protein